MVTNPKQALAVLPILPGWSPRRTTLGSRTEGIPRLVPTEPSRQDLRPTNYPPLPFIPSSPSPDLNRLRTIGVICGTRLRHDPNSSGVRLLRSSCSKAAVSLVFARRLDYCVELTMIGPASLSEESPADLGPGLWRRGPAVVLNTWGTDAQPGRSTDPRSRNAASLQNSFD
jgi:hypothetical protein